MAGNPMQSKSQVKCEERRELGPTVILVVRGGSSDNVVLVELC